MRTKVAVIIENNDKQVLLIREKTPRHPQFGWNTVKGSVDSGESLKEAALRECLEEAGVRVELQNLLGIHEVTSREEQRLQFNYIATTTDSGKVPERNEQEIRDEMIEEVKWFTREELEALTGPDMLNEGAYKLIQKYLKDKMYPLDIFTEVIE